MLRATSSRVTCVWASPLSMHVTSCINSRLQGPPFSTPRSVGAKHEPLRAPPPSGGRAGRAALLVIVQDSADPRGILEDDVLCLGTRRARGHRRRRRCRRRRCRGRRQHHLARECGGVRALAAFVEDAPLHLTQPTDLAPHLHLRVAVALEHRLGEVAKEVVAAVAMRDPGKDLGDAGDERLLLVRDPLQSRTGLPSRFAHASACLSTLFTSGPELDSSGVANHTRLSLNSRTTYSVSCPFSGLQPVDREHQVLHVAVGVGQELPARSRAPPRSPDSA